MSYIYELRSAKSLNLADYNLEGLSNGTPVTLYHGTTKLFRTFNMDLIREELVENFYGGGIFLTPSKRVAEHYAGANRNMGFDASIIADLKSKNPHAGEFLQVLVDHGSEGWDLFAKEKGFLSDTPKKPGDGLLDWEGFQKYLGVDGNTIGDIAGFILGSKVVPLGLEDREQNIFNMSTGTPAHIYDALDEVGLNSNTYRPKVYTVTVKVSNPLVTKSQSAARKARSKGHDSVVYFGPHLVGGVPEVAVFSPQVVKVKRIEVV